MDNGTRTPRLKRLESAGFITRTRDRHDERRVPIDLTPAGEAVRKGVRESVSGVPEKVEAARRLTYQEAAALRDILNDLGLGGSTAFLAPTDD